MLKSVEENIDLEKTEYSHLYPRNGIFKKYHRLEKLWFKFLRTSLKIFKFVFFSIICILLLMGEVTAFYKKNFLYKY